MRLYLSSALILALAAIGCRAPSEAPMPYDLSAVETHILTPMPTKAQPQVLEGTMTMGARPLGSRLDRTSYKAYRMSVPPGAHLKAELTNNTRSFDVVFISDSMGRVPDPGLNVNRVMGRQDAAFYENKTDAPKIIYCIVRGREAMERRGYTLALTDF